MIYYFKCSCIYIILPYMTMVFEIGNLKISILPYMLTVFGIENLKGRIVFWAQLGPKINKRSS